MFENTFLKIDGFYQFKAYSTPVMRIYHIIETYINNFCIKIEMKMFYEVANRLA